jgi:acyl-CoA thioester hydrolase
MREVRIGIRWRDMDGFDHVNNAVYLTYFEEVRDEWMASVLGGVCDLFDFVLARVAVDFRVELKQSDGEVVGSCRLERIGRSSFGTRESLAKPDGTVAATAEAVIVARDQETGRARKLTASEREALERELPSDGQE